jgi:phytoene/squalene synthetase
MDQTVVRYSTMAELEGYCRRSANPVGRLVLGAFGYVDAARVEWSDSICTGLQLAEHWQDVAEDARVGRVYLPEVDLHRFGVRIEIGPEGAERWVEEATPTPELTALMVFEVARARRYLDAGRPLLRSLPGRMRFAVAGFWAGGHAALDAIEAAGYDVLGGSPKPRPRRVAARMAAVLAGGRR